MSTQHQAQVLKHARGSFPPVSLTLIPPSPVTDRIELDIRAGIRNLASAACVYNVAVYLDTEDGAHCLHRCRLRVSAHGARAVAFRWPTRGHAGAHQIILRVESGAEVFREAWPMTIIASAMRSTQRLGGAWVDLYHHCAQTGRLFNDALAALTPAQWRELVRAMHAVDMNVMVVSMLFPHYRGYVEGAAFDGPAAYPTRLFARRAPIVTPNPLEVIMDEADRLGMHVLPGIGLFAYSTFTDDSLAWHKQVASEVWSLYGHHRSFYGWYLADEGGGDMHGPIPRFTERFVKHCKRMAPDKPMLYAFNCYAIERGLDRYPAVLKNVDIYAPFGFQRMHHHAPTCPPRRTRFSAEETAKILQKLCNESGAHFWMDMEIFVLEDDMALSPRPIEGLISDFQRFPHFEKILAFEFPGMMSAPTMSRRPGGKPSLKLYADYQRYLREGVGLAVGKPVTLNVPPHGWFGDGPQTLTAGRPGADDTGDKAWLGFKTDKLDKLIGTVDLGKQTEIGEIGVVFMLRPADGILLPARVRFAVSSDGKRFRTVGTVRPGQSRIKKKHLVAGPYLCARFHPTSVRYVRVQAWPPRANPQRYAVPGKPWFFVDEIQVYHS
ncbi:MAG: DUF4434 domain-containing protein [Verrucomicrobia bacterium]|nr:DUF4434 domain-containing protein [Verrucomicrobiota bacterium]MCG2680134.1 DUF4434 domain-containing protein [Kiritimatiellia bacterium]MBU4247043.1 DUF4434 domain-containing protein [Verrucomicrobiota bacterium]MBU4291117.1 DUF4434 domain-containing protein [Verrucomicrobiota bacterium]MBU4429006.1 DUF4434 domain-containing protein [Verrucomicrobiota bacterium]